MRLNRTSVGLKLQLEIELYETFSAPQSNQRGIETGLGSPLRPRPDEASIEPAWD